MRLGRPARWLNSLPLPAGTFDILLADPPWSYYGDPFKDQAAGKHYPCLTAAELAQLPVASIAARPAVLFLWSTSSQLEAAIHVLRSWGFHYRGVAWIWVKTTKSGAIIHGQGVRPSVTKPTTEFVLAGATTARGRPPESTRMQDWARGSFRNPAQGVRSSHSSGAPSPMILPERRDSATHRWKGICAQRSRAHSKIYGRSELP